MDNQQRFHADDSGDTGYNQSTGYDQSTCTGTGYGNTDTSAQQYGELIEPHASSSITGRTH
jgi:hypothetical protein